MITSALGRDIFGNSGNTPSMINSLSSLNDAKGIRIVFPEGFSFPKIFSASDFDITAPLYPARFLTGFPESSGKLKKSKKLSSTASREVK